MNFRIRITPWGITAIFGVLFVFSVIQSVIIYIGSKDQVKNVIHEMTFIKDKTQVDKIITKSDKFIKVTSMHSKIFAVYGQKYNKKNHWRYQGFNKHLKAATIKECVQVSDLLDLPEFSIITVGVLESSCNPVARTTNKDGSMLEAGWLQMRESAVAQATLYYNQLPPKYKKRLAFRFNSMDDLLDPINSTRIMAVLIWGLRHRYMNQWPWVFTSYHWGMSRIDKYYDYDIAPTENFIFHKGKLNEDVRDPFLYWHIFNAYNSQFEKFDIKVYIDKTYVERYLNKCSKLEYDFIKKWKWFQDQEKLNDKIKQDKIDYKEERRKDIELWNKRISEVNAEFKKAKGLLQTGKFNNLNDIWRIGKIAVLDLVNEVKDEKVAKMKKTLLISFGIFILIAFLFSIFGFIMFGRLTYKLIKR